MLAALRSSRNGYARALVGRCLRLRYSSQGLDRANRLQRRADEVYARAGVQSDDGKFIHKHKWMRWRMFNRLMDRAAVRAIALMW